MCPSGFRGRAWEAFRPKFPGPAFGRRGGEGEPAHGRGHPGSPSHPSLLHLPGKVLFAGASGWLREGVGWPHARLGAGGAWGAYGPEGGPGASAGPGGGPFGGGGGGAQLRRPPHAARGVPDPGPPPLHPGDGGRGEGGGKAVRHPDALWGAGGAGGRPCRRRPFFPFPKPSPGKRPPPFPSPSSPPTWPSCGPRPGPESGSWSRRRRGPWARRRCRWPRPWGLGCWERPRGRKSPPGPGPGGGRPRHLRGPSGEGAGTGGRGPRPRGAGQGGRGEPGLP